MLIGFGELGGIDAAEHPVAPFGLGRGIAKRLGAYHPVEQGHQSISVQFGRNLHAYCAAFTSIVPRTAFLALAAFCRPGNRRGSRRERGWQWEDDPEVGV